MEQKPLTYSAISARLLTRFTQTCSECTRWRNYDFIL